MVNNGRLPEYLLGALGVSEIIEIAFRLHLRPEVFGVKIRENCRLL